MVTPTPARRTRPAAISASTVFAIALAIVAGLIFAWLFKMVLFDNKKPPRPVDNSVALTVAAVNIYDQTEVKPINIKTIKVSPETYEKLQKNSGKTLLTGQQPVGRVTKVPIQADAPFFNEDLLPFTYPQRVSERLKPGMRAVVVTVPAGEAMVQVDDFVDAYCTLSNDVLGPGGNGTAEIAKGAKVVARFGTTRHGAQPANLTAPRTYTLEVTPYRYALIELAKAAGAKFALAVAPATRGENGDTVAVESNDLNDPRERSAERVSGVDLAALFGIGGPAPAGPAPWRIEKYVGLHPAGSSSYPGYVPPSSVPVSSPAGNGGGGTAPVLNSMLKGTPEL